MSDIEKLQKQLDMEKKINENNTNAYMKLLHTSQALEQRIESALEFIKKEWCNNNNLHECWYSDVGYLINILKGEENEK